MMNMHLLNRSGLAAIAAATAFLSTPALAQEATPVAADPAPIVADTPLPSEPSPAPEATRDSLAPVAAAKTIKSIKSIRSTRSATSSRPVAAVKATPRPVANAPVAAVPVRTPATPAPIEAPADPVMVAPLPEPVAAAPIAPVADNGSSDMLPIAGAAGLGILALAGAGFAMRRRRRDDDVVVEDNWVEPENIAAAPIAAGPMATAPISAFAWDEKPVANAAAPAPAGMSRIEAAKRGPTPDNPSASLKKRLSRAAFFDQREREVAAGTAVPVSPMAGLPERLARVEQPQRRTEPAKSFGFNRQFKPA